jgi:hypothetical protein
VSARSPLRALGTNCHSLGALPSPIRAQIRGTLATGGGWTLIPTQGGAQAGTGAGWT